MESYTDMLISSKLALKCATPLDAFKWKTAIYDSINGVGSIWKAQHPYASSFPVRKSQSVQWYVTFSTRRLLTINICKF